LEPLAEREIHAAEPRAILQRSLAPGVWLVRPARDDGDARRLRAALVGGAPISLRHIHPVQVEARVPQAGRQAVAVVAELVAPLIPSIGARRWSAQARFVGPAWAGVKAYDLNDAIAERFRGDLLLAGASYCRKAPEMIVSISIVGEELYAGVGEARANLSSWPGGMARYSGGDDPLSRSKKKLMEAIEVFGLSLPERGRAIDLGAAPGGWTQLLLERGLEVVAVDPAELDARLPGERLTHFRGPAERYLASASRTADLVTSDMRMDARDAARLMVTVAGSALRPGGQIVTTLKLPERGLIGVLDAALEILTPHFEVRARHLFHNRSEVTAHLVPRG
jgi:23S rRNA (cytidine2498-2'-O)-methyltransferase